VKCFDDFVDDTLYPFCWWCGRWSWDAPDGWHAPFTTERAHIVNSPRAELRAVCVLLCSRCHRAQHGENLGSMGIAAPTLGQMLWMKRLFDPEHWDPAVLVAHSHHCKLPELTQPPAGVVKEFRSRNEYPIFEKIARL